MSTDGKQAEIETVELLLERYGQLRELTEEKNKVIYQIFYLSVVFTGVVIGGGLRIESGNTRFLYSVFCAVVFMSMLLWTRTYVHSRSEIHSKINAVQRELESLDRELPSGTKVGELFRKRPKLEESEVEWWERQEVKNNILQAYYIVLTTLPFILL